MTLMERQCSDSQARRWGSLPRQALRTVPPACRQSGTTYTGRGGESDTSGASRHERGLIGSYTECKNCMESVLRNIRGHAAAHDLSTRILVVDDDELELALMADRLTGVGLQVVTAGNGAEALGILDREWFPVVLTDWRMPVMDGMELIESLRNKGGEEIYIIMLSANASAQDVERGYFNGVDDYLSKKCPDAELLARIEAAFNTVMLRRSLKQVRAALATAVQAHSEMQGSDGQRSTLIHLQAEMARAKRYHRLLSMLLVRASVQPAPGATAALLDAPLWRKIQHTFGGVIRIQIDWVGELERVDAAASLVVVLPETSAQSVAPVEQRLLLNLLRVVAEADPSDVRLQFDFSAVALDALESKGPVDTSQFLAAAKSAPVHTLVLQPGVPVDPALLRRQSSTELTDPPLQSDARRRASS